MPAIAIVYLLLNAVMSADDVHDLVTGRSHNEPAWYSAICIVSTAVMLLLFCGYWIKGMVEGIGVLAPVLLVVSIVWEVLTVRPRIVRAVRAHVNSVAPAVRGHAVRISVAAVVVDYIIGYWFGVLAVLRAL